MFHFLYLFKNIYNNSISNEKVSLFFFWKYIFHQFQFKAISFNGFEFSIIYFY